MQEGLEEAERYSIAALFTLALHSTASQADGGLDDWGEPDEREQHTAPSTEAPTADPDPYWGRDLAAHGGLLDAVYYQLGLPAFKWAGLKAFPAIAPPNDSAAFRSTVRSLIGVLDAELAASMPLPSTRTKAARPESPHAEPLAMPDELFAGLLASSDDEVNDDERDAHHAIDGHKTINKHAHHVVQDDAETEKNPNLFADRHMQRGIPPEASAATIDNSTSEELQEDVRWERQFEAQQAERMAGATAARHRRRRSVDSPQAQEALVTLSELTERSPRFGEGHRQRSQELSKLVQQLEEALEGKASSKEMASADESILGEGERSGEVQDDARTSMHQLPPQEQAASRSDVEELETQRISSLPLDAHQQRHFTSAPPQPQPLQQEQKCPDATRPSSASSSSLITSKPSTRAVEASPIAIAALWELLHCCIGASVAAAEAAKAAAELGAAASSAANSCTRLVLRRQGPPPCLRWYDARARVALTLMCVWLQIPQRKLASLEVLLGSNKAPSAASQRNGAAAMEAAADQYRYLKVGLAALGGGALFAVTGGLAAPAIAAGMGSLLGIVPGASAAAGAVAGFMSTSAGVAAVTTTMATAGAATTGSKMANRTADVKDFGFHHLSEDADMLPPVPSTSLRNSSRSVSSSKASLGSTGRESLPGGGRPRNSDGGGGGLTPIPPPEATTTATTTTALPTKRNSATALPADPGHLTLGHASQLGSSSEEGDGLPRKGSQRNMARDPSSWRSWFTGPGDARAAVGGEGTVDRSRDSHSEFDALRTPATPERNNSETDEKRGATEDTASPPPLLQSPLRPLMSPGEGIKLSTVICIGGWISSPDDYVTPWRPLAKRCPASDAFAMVWCIAELQALNRALGGLLAKGAVGQATSFGLQHLVVGGAGLVTALGPTVLLGSAAGLVIDNAWTTAGERADKAGKLLAHVLMEGGAGAWARPTTIVAHSMGARAAFSALLELCRCGARGLIQDCVLLGAPVAPNEERWRMARRAVAGRLVNGYSRRDWLLSVVYWQGLVRPPAGLAPVEVSGVENVSLGSVVSGHFEYPEKVVEILDLVEVVVA